jgi:hypothetical protein
MQARLCFPVPIPLRPFYLAVGGAPCSGRDKDRFKTQLLIRCRD